MNWLKLSPAWLWWALALLVVGGAQQYRLVVLQAETAEVRQVQADQALLHKQHLVSMSNAAAAQARRALEKQQSAEQALRDLDIKMSKEKTDALNENDRLRRAIADGDRRLRIAGSCRAGGSDVPSTAATTSLGGAGTVELAPAAGRTVLDIRAGIIADQSALRSLQIYIKEVCHAQ